MQTLENRAGLYLVDKPTGVTSHQVVSWFRRQTGFKRIGHAGTLDPLATGLLIVLVSREFTKQQSKYLKQDKAYLCTAVFGQTTDTYDVDGTVTATASPELVEEVTESTVLNAMKTLTGTIRQTVPAYSAVKRQGKKLYELARAGKIVQEALPTRTVNIIEFSLEEFSPGQKATVQVAVRCSSGTYIRSLIHDLGQLLGVGATVTALRRTAIGSVTLSEAQFCPLFQHKKT